jgi:hypothetical protein
MTISGSFLSPPVAYLGIRGLTNTILAVCPTLIVYLPKSEHPDPNSVLSLTTERGKFWVKGLNNLR